MSPEAQRISIAEACGWTRRDNSLLNQERPELLQWYWLNPKGSSADVPDYLNDLNAMHEAEQGLLEDGKRGFKWGLYRANLIDVAPLDDHVHARAYVRAEAFLRTLNLWKE